jgi:RNA polymerase sigma-70 factor (ECF subfamily)
VNVKAEDRAAPVVFDALDLDALAREQLPRVERLLLRILGPRKDMEDLVQTVFLELCRALPRRRGDAAMSTFVGGITVNVARRAMRPPAFWRRRAPMIAEADGKVSDPERHASAREQLRCVRQALETIAPKKRIAFTLWAFEEMDVADVAALMGASVSTTWSRIWYAQKALRDKATRDPALRQALGGEV